mgnify:CR=1 FL=1
MRNRYLEKFDSRVRIRVSGNNVHNYLKRVLKKKINIYRVIPISRKEIDLILNYSEYEKLLEYKSIYEIKLLGYLGKKRWKDQLGQNSLLLFFMVLGLGLIVLLSHVVSEVEVIHQDQAMRLFLRDELERYGIKKYTFKKNYEELEKIEERILKDNKDKLEWIEIIEYGTKYTVRVEERKINQEENTYQYQHIISRKNAVIKRIDAVSGEKVKFVNDYVKKGDIIISGDVSLPDNTKVSTMAKGKVYGEVWYQVSVDYPYVYQESKLTGKSKNVYAIYFFGKKFSLFDFHQYRTFQKEKKILFSINMLDIHFGLEKQHETIVKDEVYTEDMLSAKALLYVKEKLFRDNPYIQSIEEIKVLREDSSETGVYFQMFVQVIEDIGEVLPGVKE